MSGKIRFIRNGKYSTVDFPDWLIGKEFDVIDKLKDGSVVISIVNHRYRLETDEFEWVEEKPQNKKRIRITNLYSEKYGDSLPSNLIGQEFDVVSTGASWAVINYNGEKLSVFNGEYEWVDGDEQTHESKLSCDEKEDSNYKVEDTIVESSNSLKKHGYMPIVNEVSYYEVSTFDASYILHEHLESIGYDIAGVWFDQESKTFRAIKKKV